MLNIYIISVQVKSIFLFKKCFFLLVSLLVIFIPFKSTAAIIPFINEIHYDNTGTDSNEFVEIAGLVGTNLDNWQLYLYNGSNKQLYKTYSLTNKTFLNSQNGFGFISILTSGIQNGAPDGIALTDASGKIIQFISYEGVFSIQYNGKTMISKDIGVSESSKTALNYSLQLSGEGNIYSDFNWQNASPMTAGKINTGQRFIPLSKVSEPNTTFLFFGSLLFLLFTKSAPIVEKR